MMPGVFAVRAFKLTFCVERSRAGYGTATVDRPFPQVRGTRSFIPYVTTP